MAEIFWPHVPVNKTEKDNHLEFEFGDYVKFKNADGEWRFGTVQRHSDHGNYYIIQGNDGLDWVVDDPDVEFATANTNKKEN